jgi:DMSO/TMAO reductase YedYZ molybdopterin-dependent catalytic subunit
MNNEEKGNSFEPEVIPAPATGSKPETASRTANREDTNPAVPIGTETLQAGQGRERSQTDEVVSCVAARQEMAKVPERGFEDADPSVLLTIEKAEGTEASAGPGRSPSLTQPATQTGAEVPPAVATQPIKKHLTFFQEQRPPVVEMAPRVLRDRTRREVLMFGVGAVAAAAGAGSLLPQSTLGRLGVRRDLNSRGRDWLLNKALRIDDDVAEALYSRNRMVPTYTKSQITPIKNNYNGSTPDPGYISGWNLTLDGLASGLRISLDIRKLTNRLPMLEQITRLVCVEGWSAVAWWAGLRFEDLLRAYPPMWPAKWARVESSVNLDASGNPDPYFVSIDLATARHPQTLLATHLSGQPLTVEHGAPLRLLVPVKLGLKNVKAVTRITYTAEEPKDYWASYGYSSYDGI